MMAQMKISWVNWTYSDDFRSGAVFTEGTCPGGPFAGTSRLKPAGQLLDEAGVVDENRGLDAVGHAELG